MTQTAEELRASSLAHRQEAIDSFDRCDTDGFVSQWAHGICGSRDRLAADILDNGGLWEFLTLMDLDGNWVPSRIIETRFGERWMVLDADGKATGQFLPVTPVRRNTLAKHGFTEGRVMRPAKAVIKGTGHGLSGTAWAAVVPVSKPWEVPVSISCVDRYAPVSE